MPLDIGGFQITAGMEDNLLGSPITSGLQLYLDANNPESYTGSTTTWYDVSGNGRNFNWYYTPSFSSENGVNYFNTLGNNSIGPASNSFGITNTSGYTIFMIFRQLSLVNTSAFIFYGSAPYDRGIFSHCTWSNDVIYFDQGGCCNSDTRTQVASGGTSSYSVVGFRRLTNSSTRSIWKNGTSLITNTATAANINLTSTGVRLGYGETTNSGTWNARLNAFLVYNRGLSDSEMEWNSFYLQNKLGI